MCDGECVGCGNFIACSEAWEKWSAECEADLADDQCGTGNDPDDVDNINEW